MNKQYWIDTIGKEWTTFLADILKQEYMKKVMSFMSVEYATNDIFPKKDEIFKAFAECPLDKLKVVILAYEPSQHSGEGGLAYSGNNYHLHQPWATSNIVQCIEREFYDGLNLNRETTFENYAKQGVLFLHKNLTNRKSGYGCHEKQWNKFFLFLISKINQDLPGTIFLIWEEETKQYKELLTNCDVLTFTSPTDKSVLFDDWKCEHFKKVNEIIEKRNGVEFKIKW